MYRQAILHIGDAKAHDTLLAILVNNVDAFDDVCDHIHDYYVRGDTTIVVAVWDDHVHDLPSLQHAFAKRFPVVSIEDGPPHVPDGLNAAHARQLQRASDSVWQQIRAGTLSDDARDAFEQAQRAAIDQGSAAIEDFMWALSSVLPEHQRRRE